MTSDIPMALLPAIQQMPVWTHGSTPKLNPVVPNSKPSIEAAFQQQLANDFRRAMIVAESSKLPGAMIRIGPNGTKFYWVRARKILTRYPFESTCVSVDPAQHRDRNPRFVKFAELYFVTKLKRESKHC